MPVFQEIDEGRVPVRVYTGEIEPAARAQLVNISRLPIVHHHVAAMPDVHLGIGATVGSVIPTVRANAQREIDAVNTILASPGLREAHINALVQVALQPGHAGIDIDYPRVNAARKADFTSFITVLGDRLRQSA